MKYDIINKYASLFYKFSDDLEENIIVEWDPNDEYMEDDVPIVWEEDTPDLYSIRKDFLRTDGREDLLEDPWKQLKYFADKAELIIYMNNRERGRFNVMHLLDWVMAFILNKKRDKYHKYEVPVPDGMVYLKNNNPPILAQKSVVNRKCKKCGEVYTDYDIIQETEHIDPQIFEAEGEFPEMRMDMINCVKPHDGGICGTTMALPRLSASRRVIFELLLKFARNL